MLFHKRLHRVPYRRTLHFLLLRMFPGNWYSSSSSWTMGQSRYHVHTVLPSWCYVFSDIHQSVSAVLSESRGIRASLFLLIGFYLSLSYYKHFNCPQNKKMGWIKCVKCIFWKLCLSFLPGIAVHHKKRENRGQFVAE